MLAYASVTGDLAGLLLNFIQQQGLSMPNVVAELNKYGATSRMKYTDWWRYLQLIRDEMDQPEVGLLIGQAVQTSDAGVIGYLTASCDSLMEALANFQRYQKLLYEGDLAKIEMQGDQIRFYWPYDYGYSTKESDEVLISGLVTFFRQLLNDDSIKPISIDFIHSQPERSDLYDQVFQCEVNFAQQNLAVVVSSEYINLKLPKPDQGLNMLLQQQADSLMQGLSQQDDYLQAVRMTILKLLPLNQANLEQAAKHLNTSARSFNRRLSEKKTSFKELLAEVRYHQAQEYLRQNKMTHSEIALLLGYSEQSAFSRAFKQWAGQTPLQYQKAVL